MESIIQKLYFSNKEVTKPIDDERISKLLEIENSIIDIVGNEKFGEYEALASLISGLAEERAYKEGFKAGVKVIIEGLG